jgi:hypothetical protein
MENAALINKIHKNCDQTHFLLFVKHFAIQIMFQTIAIPRFGQIL